MVVTLLKELDFLVVWMFWLHDKASAFLVRHLFTVKRTILVVAHLSLLGLLLPEMRRDFGELAGNLLIVILFLSPLSRITRSRLLLQIMGLRRELGILMGYLAIVHGLGYMIDPRWQELIFAPFPWQAALSQQAVLAYGVVALLLTLPLLFTSNTFSQKHLGKNWKRLHRVVYALFGFAVLHRFFWHSDGFAFVQASVLLGSYVFLKLLAWKPFWPAFEAWRSYVAQRYREYQAGVQG